MWNLWCRPSLRSRREDFRQRSPGLGRLGAVQTAEQAQDRSRYSPSTQGKPAQRVEQEVGRETPSVLSEEQEAVGLLPSKALSTQKHQGESPNQLLIKALDDLGVKIAAKIDADVETVARAFWSAHEFEGMGAGQGSSTLLRTLYSNVDSDNHDR